MRTRSRFVAPCVMSLLLLSSVALARSPRGAQPALLAPPVVVDGALFESQLDSVVEGLAGVRVLAEGRLGPGQRAQLLREVEMLREQVLALRDAVRSAPAAGAAPVGGVAVGTVGGPGVTVGVVGGPAVTVGAVPAPQPQVVVVAAEPAGAPVVVEEVVDEGPLAMEAGEFEEAVASVRKEGFDDGKLAVVSEVVRYNWFRVDQVRRLLDLFSFGEDKLRALRLLAPRIVDPERNHQLFDAFSFDSDKKKARAILAR